MKEFEKDNEAKYEVQATETEETDLDLMSVPVEPEDEDEGLSTGAIIFLTAAATAGGIWLGTQLVKVTKKLLGKIMNASEADEEAEAGHESEAEPAEDFGSDEA